MGGGKEGWQEADFQGSFSTLLNVKWHSTLSLSLKGGTFTSRNLGLVRIAETISVERGHSESDACSMCPLK